MKIAIITGASSGLGMEFSDAVKTVFPEVEELWLVARRVDRLEEYAKSSALPVKALPLDLCGDEGINSLRLALEDAKPDVSLLVNCAGCGYLGNVDELDPVLMTRSIDLNVRGLTAVTAAVLPYMKENSGIVNISSIASFCPNARMTVYSSTKAYVSSFSRGLKEELRGRGINVTAVCPGPMVTEFLDVGNIKGNSKMFAMLPYDNPKKVAVGSLKASKRGCTFYTPHPFFKFYRVLTKILPQAIMVKLCKT